MSRCYSLRKPIPARRRHGALRSIWLRAPHPDLGGATPLSFILSGRSAAILALLHLADSGQTS